MNNFIFSINAVLPVFLLIFLGYFLTKTGILTKKFSDVSSKFVFMIALPSLLFLNILKADFSGIFNVGLLKAIMFVFVSVLIIFLILTVYAKKSFDDEGKRGAFIQGCFRANYVMLGIPLIYNIASDEGVIAASLMAAFIIPYFNILAIIALSIHRKTSFRSVSVLIIKNPLIVSIILGVIASAIKIELPFVINKTVEMLSVIAIPLALLSIGVFFDFGRFLSQIKTVLMATAIKTVLIPLIFTPLAYLAGIRGVYLISIYVLLAAPTAVSSYIMAKGMDADSEIASGIIILTTAFSLVTLFSGIFILRSLNII